MPKLGNRFKRSYLPVIGTICVLLLALALLWHGNANSMQAMPAMVAGVYFDGEYRIADGQWQQIEKGKHISSTKGDVTTVSASVLGWIPELLTRLLQFFGTLAVILYYDPTLALLALLSAPITLLMSRYVIKMMRQFYCSMKPPAHWTWKRNSWF